MTFSNLFARAAQLRPHVFLSGAVAVAIGIGGILAANPAQSQVVSAAYSPRQIVIGNDMGGDVGARANKIALMRSNGESVAIRGPSCYSACTMYLALPGSCVDRDTRFGFHAPGFYGRQASAEQFEFWSQVIAGHYPASLQKWYLAEARHSSRLRMVDGAEIIRLGVPECS